MNPGGASLAPLSIFFWQATKNLPHLLFFLWKLFSMKIQFQIIYICTAVDFSLSYLFDNENKKQNIVTWYPEYKFYGNILPKKIKE